MKLDQIIDLTELRRLVDDGFIRERQHPLDPSLCILNYTEKAQYEREWNSTTKACRGLIYDAATLEVLARPYKKFFNYGEYAADRLELHDPVQVVDKLDGSLGILYKAPDGWAIATRGSFDSEQARHATQVLRERYLPHVELLDTDGWTYLFEIIYPENRIVVDYQDQDDLVLLGRVATESGRPFGPHPTAWSGPIADTFTAKTLAQALALPPRPNREGLVVRYIETGLMVKLKQPDYVALHRIVTGLSVKTVWEHLSLHDGDITAMVMSLPDEFHGWVDDHTTRFLDSFEQLYGQAWAAHQELVHSLHDGWGRKDYAIAAKSRHADLAPLMFTLLDGKDPAPAIWRSLKPVGHSPMTLYSEDNA